MTEEASQEQAEPRQPEIKVGEAVGEAAGGQEILEQARDLAGAGKVRLRIDDTELPATYANSFRTNVTVEEVLLDFGLNSIASARRTDQGVEAEILFKTSSRVIFNYYTAKRLAITLGRLVKNYETRFGELKLSVPQREVKK